MHCDIESTTDVDCMNSCRCCIGVLYHWLFSQKHVSVFLRPIQHTLPCSISFLTCSYLLLACYFYLCVVLTNVLGKTTRCRVVLQKANFVQHIDVLKQHVRRFGQHVDVLKQHVYNTSRFLVYTCYICMNQPITFL